jgi:putative Holliday junction resolvase
VIDDQAAAIILQQYFDGLPDDLSV